MLHIDTEVQRTELPLAYVGETQHVSRHISTMPLLPWAGFRFSILGIKDIAVKATECFLRGNIRKRG